MAALEERTQAQGRDIEDHERRIRVLEVNWAKLIGITMGASAIGGLGGGGLVAVISRLVGT